MQAWIIPGTGDTRPMPIMQREAPIPPMTAMPGMVTTTMGRPRTRQATVPQHPVLVAMARIHTRWATTPPMNPGVTWGVWARAVVAWEERVEVMDAWAESMAAWAVCTRIVPR